MVHGENRDLIIVFGNYLMKIAEKDKLLIDKCELLITNKYNKTKYY